MLDFNFPPHWKKIRLSTLFVENKEKNTAFSENKALQFYFGTIIQKKKFEMTDELIETYKKYTVVKPCDIVINGLNLNYDFVSQRIGLVTEPGIITSAYITLRAKNNFNINYYVYFFKTLDAQKFFHGMGSGVRLTLSYKDLRNILLPVPPLDEQEKIVRYLDKKTAQISTFVESKKKQFELLDELKRAVISEAVTKNSPHWKKIRLKYLAINVNDKKNYLGGNYVGLENIESGTGKITSVNFENESFVESVLNSFDERFILFAKLRPYLAKVATPNFEGQCSTELLTLLPKENIYKKFLFYVMISQWFIEIVNSSTYGTKMPRANWNFISNIKISVPPIDEQIEIAAYLDEKCTKIDKLRACLQDEIKYVEELKTRIISDVVTGKLDVRELV